MSKNTDLNIVMLGHKRIPSREGGVEVVVEELSTRMAALGYPVTCLNRTGHHVSGEAFDSVKMDRYKGVRIKRVPTINARGMAAVTSSLSGGILAALGPWNVVHYHAEGPCLSMWIPKLFGKRCIATVHGLDHQRAKWGTAGRLVILLGERMAVRCADEIIVLSENVQKYFKEKYGRDTMVIPNGVNRPEKLAPNLITEKYGLKGDDYLLFVGRIVPEKGPQYLIEAFKMMNTDKKLVIAGGASDTAEFYDLVREMNTLGDKIIFTDFIQGDLLREIYSNAYCYILPSDLEGMPLTLLEAMSFGNCCVTSDIAECADVVGSYGVTFKANNVVDLAEKLQDLCDHPDKVQDIRDASARFLFENHDWNKTVEQTLALYRGE